jgi:putative intracellular protease/amidase
MKILILLPSSDYDPTESAVPWQAMVNASHDITFSTPDGQPAYADQRLVDKGFSLLTPFLMTRKADLVKYQAMIASDGFNQPLAYGSVVASDYDGLYIPGGHAPGMKSMLESKEAQAICQYFMHENKPVAAVCHGVLLLARSQTEEGESVLAGRTTTGLISSMELSAWALTAPWLGRYYRTYPMTVEAEVKQALGAEGTFEKGPLLPIRDSENYLRFGFTVKDKNYLSARWPGDCNKFASDWIKLLQANC